MAHLLIPRGERRREMPSPPPHLPYWYLAGDEPDWRYVVVCCPHGHLSTLRHLSRNEGHQIAPDGTVSPSVVCPHDGCDFHEFVRLENWT